MITGVNYCCECVNIHILGVTSFDSDYQYCPIRFLKCYLPVWRLISFSSLGLTIENSADCNWFIDKQFRKFTTWQHVCFSCVFIFAFAFSSLICYTLHNYVNHFGISVSWNILIVLIYQNTETYCLHALLLLGETVHSRPNEVTRSIFDMWNLFKIIESYIIRYFTNCQNTPVMLLLGKKLRATKFCEFCANGEIHVLEEKKTTLLSEKRGTER